jgi:hypothetical protein
MPYGQCVPAEAFSLLPSDLKPVAGFATGFLASAGKSALIFHFRAAGMSMRRRSGC